MQGFVTSHPWATSICVQAAVGGQLSDARKQKIAGRGPAGKWMNMNHLNPEGKFRGFRIHCHVGLPERKSFLLMLITVLMTMMLMVVKLRVTLAIWAVMAVVTIMMIITMKLMISGTVAVAHRNAFS